ncbi:MAG: tRNA (5-methylaminomethyl-2-thiouridine)(34)-methyltransferase MnmD [Saprospiraceae bacterium]|nr:tRNA (5-methylaminomethyl-2-thiouridine)(34)-methyltransferase MnmD [Saprospiraceae bacterium]
MSILLSADGSHTLLSEKYGVTYHSRYGAVTETTHVFIGAGLHWKAQYKLEISVLEIGFGTGLNTFMTMLEAEQQSYQVRYVTLETMPLTVAAAEALNYPEILEVPQRRDDFLRLHRCAWNEPQVYSPCFSFEKKQLSLLDFYAKNAFDLVYFDAFAPQAQPEMWEEAVFGGLFDALREGGGLVTYCAQGEFRRRLRRSGFMVEKLPGPPGKREMTRAIKQTSG